MSHGAGGAEFLKLSDIVQNAINRAAAEPGSRALWQGNPGHEVVNGYTEVSPSIFVPTALVRALDPKGEREEAIGITFVYPNEKENRATVRTYVAEPVGDVHFDGIDVRTRELQYPTNHVEPLEVGRLLFLDPHTRYGGVMYAAGMLNSLVVQLGNFRLPHEVGSGQDNDLRP